MSYIFLFRKISTSAFSAVRLVLKLLTISPAAENILSEGTNLAGIQRYCLARIAKVGNHPSLFFHQVRGSES